MGRGDGAEVGLLGGPVPSTPPRAGPQPALASGPSRRPRSGGLCRARRGAGHRGARRCTCAREAEWSEERGLCLGDGPTSRDPGSRSPRCARAAEDCVGHSLSAEEESANTKRGQAGFRARAE